MRPDDERECAEYLRASLPRLHRAAYLLRGDATEADDIVQATAVALYLHWRRVRAADNIEGYVRRVLDRPAPPVQSTVEDRDEMSGALARLRRGAANAAGRP